jgi:CubicO group peptidase (beta-lactamase class C family)
LNRLVKARFGGPFLCIALAAALAAEAHAQSKEPSMKPKKDAAAPSATKAALDGLEAFFKERSSAHGIVGAGLRVVGYEGALLQVSFGFKDLATSAKADEATIYHWASITKTLTGIAIMQLRDRGKLSLDDPILKYVPELAAVHNPFGPMGAITIRQLLSGPSAATRTGIPSSPPSGRSSWP